MRFNGVCLLKYLNTSRITVAEFVDRLVRVTHKSDMHAVLSQPREYLQIKRVTVLPLVHYDFVETCRQCKAKRTAIHWITNQPQRLNASIGGAKVASLQQATSPLCRSLLVSILMLVYVIS